MRKIIFTLFFIGGLLSAKPQLKVTALKGVAGTYTENLSFPVIRSSDARIAARIDSTLQAEVLGYENVVTDQKNFFTNTAYIPYPDSNAQSGFNSIAFEILLNNARVFSIAFYLESTGAYSEGYERFYCFDAQTGSLLTEKDLFTDEGVKYLRSLLSVERAKRINKFLTGEIPDIEDSAFARERYEECNGDAGISQFVIQPQQILFFKEDCFPHVMRPFDIDLNVAMSFVAIKKYLSPRGKELLGM